MIADRIKILREANNMTQSQLAKKLGITRSSVNSWEMGLSVPSTQYIIDLAILFNVSSDYLLGLPNNPVVSVDGLSDKETAVIVETINYYNNYYLSTTFRI